MPKYTQVGKHVTVRSKTVLPEGAVALLDWLYEQLLLEDIEENCRREHEWGISMIAFLDRQHKKDKEKS